MPTQHQAVGAALSLVRREVNSYIPLAQGISKAIGDINTTKSGIGIGRFKCLVEDHQSVRTVKQQVTIADCSGPYCVSR